MDCKKIFSERLSALRRQKGVSRAALGEYLSVTDEAVRLLEKGKRAPSFESLCALADYFGVTLDDLVGTTYEYTAVDEGGAWGIELRSDGHGPSVLVPDISPDQSVVMKLVEKLNKYQISPSHMKDVIEDMISMQV